MSGGRPPAGHFDDLAAAELRRARVMAGMTQADVAAQMGVTYQQAYKYEIGENRMSVDRFIRAFQAVGVDPGETMRRIASVGERPPIDVNRAALADAEAIMSMSPETRRALVRIGRIIEETNDA